MVEKAFCFSHNWSVLNLYRINITTKEDRWDKTAKQTLSQSYPQTLSKDELQLHHLSNYVRLLCENQQCSILRLSLSTSGTKSRNGLFLLQPPEALNNSPIPSVPHNCIFPVAFPCCKLSKCCDPLYFGGKWVAPSQWQQWHNATISTHEVHMEHEGMDLLHISR